MKLKIETYWYIVGSAVTIKRPLSPGASVTSTLPTLIPSSFFWKARLFQIGSRALHAGHHGA